MDGCKRFSAIRVCGLLAMSVFAYVGMATADEVTVGDFDSLTNALVAANAAGGGVIRLLPGEYELSGYMTTNNTSGASHLHLKSGVSLIGLNADGEVNTLEEAGNVKLIGDGTMSGIWCDSNSSVFVKGVTITGCGTNQFGKATGGIVRNGNVVDCIVTNNVSFGATFFNSCNVERCDIRNNVFDVQNGCRGVFGGVIFTECLIYSNRVLHAGDAPRYAFAGGKILRSKLHDFPGVTFSLISGTVCEDSILSGGAGTPTIAGKLTNCILLGMKNLDESTLTNCIVANVHGARYAVNNVTAKNTLFYNLRGWECFGKGYGSGLVTQSSLEDCTIVGAYSTDQDAAIGSGCVLVNCIVAESTCPRGDFQTSNKVDVLPEATYSMWEKEEIGYELGENNVGAVEDPHFAGTAEWDVLGMGWNFESALRSEFWTANPYRILRKSAARDNGDPETVAEAVDLTGGRRVLNGRIDIGAFEAPPSKQTKFLLR